ncbi:MAG: helix-turn-helix domain-containing protein [Gammaproteobacteria bacterium]|jgi:transcriptional regulator with XRE-family HTH domain|nr:helix-turn-helix domain-containing protein [Gammaproteobacteria bacterium]
MKINAELIIKQRKEKHWTQEELAIATGLNVRTIQRVESEASASLESKKALASALDINIQDLDFEENRMKPCPICKSDEIYQYQEYFQHSGVGEELLPKLGKGVFGVAKICPFVCCECGYTRLMASSETRERLAESEHWKKI